MRLGIRHPMLAMLVRSSLFLWRKSREGQTRAAGAVIVCVCLSLSLSLCLTIDLANGAALVARVSM